MVHAMIIVILETWKPCMNIWDSYFQGNNKQLDVLYLATYNEDSVLLLTSAMSHVFFLMCSKFYYYVVLPLKGKTNSYIDEIILNIVCICLYMLK